MKVKNFSKLLHLILNDINFASTSQVRSATMLFMTK